MPAFLIKNRLALQSAFRISLSITLTYWLGLALNWPAPQNGVIAIAVSSMASIGASYQKGVLRVAIFETALKDIQHTECFFSIRERLLGLGTITFATSGTAMIEAMWRMVADPMQVHQTVVKTLSRYR